MQETWVRSLGQEDPMEEEMATHSSILAWKIPWTEEPGRLQSMGSQRVRHDFVTEHALTLFNMNRGFHLLRAFAALHSKDISYLSVSWRTEW